LHPEKPGVCVMTSISDHMVGIVGLIIGIVGVVIGVIGVIIAFKSDQKMKTARQAQKAVEKKLLHHMATRAFDNLAIDAIAVTTKIRERDWIVVAELGDNLGRRVGETRGAWHQLLEPLEKDMLDSAAASIQQFFNSIPIGNQVGNLQEPEENLQLMLARCRSLVNVASEIAGRLGVQSIQQHEE
jgi:hypothetical protein